LLTVRPARSAEAGALARIGLFAWEVAIASWGEDVERLRANATAAYTDFCNRCWPDIVVAEWDGAMAGWGASENADDEITDLWVLPTFQGRGIGTRLIGELETAIRARGHQQARLGTHARNLGAIRLCKELGYHVSAYMVAYAPSLDTDIDKVEMVKSFAADGDGGPEGDADRLPGDGLYGDV